MLKTFKRQACAMLATMGLLVSVFALAPSASAYPDDTGGVSVGTTSPSAGGSLPISGTNCRPDSVVTLTLDTGTVLGTATTDANGNYTTTVQLPSGVTGQHNITVSGAQCAATAGVTIQAVGGGSSGGLAGTGVAVVGIGVLGVVLLIGGGLMLFAGRRRKNVAA
jgi:hypothetical protein